MCGLQKRVDTHSYLYCHCQFNHSCVLSVVVESFGKRYHFRLFISSAGALFCLEELQIFFIALVFYIRQSQLRSHEPVCVFFYMECYRAKVNCRCYKKNKKGPIRVPYLNKKLFISHFYTFSQVHLSIKKLIECSSWLHLAKGGYKEIFSTIHHLTFCWQLQELLSSKTEIKVLFPPTSCLT